MNDESEIIREKIENGSYYKDAKSWYAERFIHPVTQKSYFVIIITITFLIVFYCIYAVYNFLPLKRTVSYAISVEDMSEDLPHLIPLAANKAEPNEALVNYLLNNFLIAWESYNYDLLQKNNVIIHDYADPSLYQRYMEYISLSNPNSPLMRFKRHTEREVIVLSYSPLFFDSKLRSGDWLEQVMRAISGNDSKPEATEYKSTLIYQSFEKNVLGTKSDLWRADFTFTYMPVRLKNNSMEFEELAFKVTDIVITPYQDASSTTSDSSK